MSRKRTVVSVLTWVAAGLLLAACGGGGNEQSTATVPPTTASPTPSPTSSTPTPTATPSIEEEVAEAYLAYWEAYAQAALNLDISLVEASVSDGERTRISEEIESMRANDVALRVHVEHDFQVFPESESLARVIDEIVNDSFFVDAVTKDPPEGTGSGEVLRYTFVLEKVEGRWIVTQGSRSRLE